MRPTHAERLAVAALLGLPSAQQELGINLKPSEDLRDVMSAVVFIEPDGSMSPTAEQFIIDMPPETRAERKILLRCIAEVLCRCLRGTGGAATIDQLQEVVVCCNDPLELAPAVAADLGDALADCSDLIGSEVVFSCLLEAAKEIVASRPA